MDSAEKGTYEAGKTDSSEMKTILESFYDVAAKDSAPQQLDEIASVTMSGDSADEVAQLVKLMSDAGAPEAAPVGAQPVDMPEPVSVDGPPDMPSKADMMTPKMMDDLESEEEVIQDEYANEPDEKYDDHQKMTHDLSGGLNRQKGAYADAEDGDNAMAVEGKLKEELSKMLKQKMSEKKESKPDYIDLDGDGDTKEPMKKAAKDKKKAKSKTGKDTDVAEDDDPCWKNYKQVGMKKKGGKKVPNCVPKESVETYDDSDFFEAHNSKVKEAGKKRNTFDYDDVFKIQKMDLESAREYMIDLVQNSTMTPRKKQHHTRQAERARSINDLMYQLTNLVLSGEGQATIGSGRSMRKSDYRQMYDSVNHMQENDNKLSNWDDYFDNDREAGIDRDKNSLWDFSDDDEEYDKRDPEDAMAHLSDIDPNELGGELDWDDPEDPEDPDKWSIANQRYRKKNSSRRAGQYATKENSRQMTPSDRKAIMELMKKFKAGRITSEQLQSQINALFDKETVEAQRDPVAKNMNKFNKSQTHKNKKAAQKRGEKKHKSDYMQESAPVFNRYVRPLLHKEPKQIVEFYDSQARPIISRLAKERQTLASKKHSTAVHDTVLGKLRESLGVLDSKRPKRNVRETDEASSAVTEFIMDAAILFRDQGISPSELVGPTKVYNQASGKSFKKTLPNPISNLLQNIDEEESYRLRKILDQILSKTAQDEKELAKEVADAMVSDYGPERSEIPAQPSLYDSKKN